MNLIIPADSIFEQHIYFPIIDKRLEDWEAEKSSMQIKNNTKEWWDEFHEIAKGKIPGYEPPDKPAGAFAFYQLSDLIAFLLFNFLLRYRSIIISKNINKIYLLASDWFIKEFEEQFSERFDYLALLANYHMNNTTKMFMPQDQGYFIIPDIHHLVYKGLMKQISDLAYWDPEYEAITDKYKLLNYQEITPEITADERSAISKWDVEFLSYQEFVDKNEPTLENKEIFYFREHLDCGISEFLSTFDKAIGLDFANENEVDMEYLEVYNELTPMSSYLSRFDQINKLHNVPFIQALDPDLKSKIENLVKGNLDNRFLCLINPDNVITRKVLQFLTTKLDLEPNGNAGFENLGEFSADEPDKLSAKYLTIEGFERWDIRLQRTVWKGLEAGALKDGFVLFISNDRPKDYNIKLEFDNDHVWIFDRQMIDKNISLIFHSLISEKYDLPISDMLYKAIKHNVFRDLIMFPDMRLDVLRKTLRSFGDTPQFNYLSAESWYKYRKEYDKNIPLPEDINKQKKENDPPEQELRFIYNEKTNQWKISGYVESKISYKNTKTILYAIVIILHTKRFNKGIAIKTVVGIVNELDRKYNGKEIVESKSEKSDPVRSALKLEKAIHNYPMKLKKLFLNNIKFKHGLYYFDPELKLANEKTIKINCSIPFFEESGKLFGDVII